MDRLGPRDIVAVEALGVGLVTGDQQDRRAVGIEGVEHADRGTAPDAKLAQVAMSRALDA